MNFDYTYIYAFGFVFYEPIVVLTNTVFFLISLYFFKNLIKFSSIYAKQMARFILLLGVSNVFGAIGHTAHYQLGNLFFNSVVLLMNASSLFAVYFLFKASYSYYYRNKEVKPYFEYLVLAWIILMLFVSWMNSNFMLIKIHAALVLLYTLYTHYTMYTKTKERGNELLIFGILLSFSPILVHSMHLSLNEWFNHKDLAHILMIISLCIIYKGLRFNVRAFELEGAV